MPWMSHEPPPSGFDLGDHNSKEIWKRLDTPENDVINVEKPRIYTYFPKGTRFFLVFLYQNMGGCYQNLVLSASLSSATRCEPFRTQRPGEVGKTSSLAV